MRKLTFFICLFMVACASWLPRYLGEKHKPEVESNLDLAQVEFFHIDTEEYISGETFMSHNSLDFMLLIFGSKGCTACSEKMAMAKEAIIPEFEHVRNFGVFGVYADDVSYAPLIRRYRQMHEYSFLQFLDPQAAMLLKWFLPETMEHFGVPVTVMIGREQGVLWNYGFKDPYTSDEIIEKITDSLSVAPEPTLEPTPEPQPTPEPTPDPSLEPTPEPTPEPSPDPIPSGPDVDFILYDGGEVDLAKLAGEHEYLIMNTFSEWCASCREELQHWSVPDGLYDFCAGVGNCGFYTVENGPPEEEDFSTRYPRIQDLMIGWGVTVPLLLDPQPASNGGWEGRYFDGYLTGKYPEWEFQFGTVLYHEGQIIKGWISGAEIDGEIRSIIGGGE